MTQCKCGFNKGDQIVIVGWDGKSHDGCWVLDMHNHIGKCDVIECISHDDDGRCVVELDEVDYFWETRWLEKVKPYTLF